MKIKLNSAVWILSVGGTLLFFCARAFTQQNAMGHATDFTSVEYYEPPHGQQMKTRLSGAEAQPEAGGLLEIRRLKLEAFDLDGKLQMTITAPDCVYDTSTGAASSPGRLQMQTGDGKIRMEGDGFLWQSTSSCLIISNNVKTVIESASLSPQPAKSAP